MSDYVVAYEVTRSFTADELSHNPDPEEVMAILVRQVEHALERIGAVAGTMTIKRLRYVNRSGWDLHEIDGVTGGPE